MKKKFTKLMAALALLVLVALPAVGWGQTKGSVNYVFSDHYSSNTVLDETPIAFDGVITATFNKRSGGTATQYYTNGYAVRWYGGGTLDIVATNATMSSITLTFGSGDGTNAITTNVGSYENGAWTGSASSVTFTQAGTSGNRRISAITVTYTTSSGTTQLTTPTNFQATAGNTQAVFTWDAVSNASGYTISYTSDGSSWQEETVTDGSTTTKTITSLTNGTTYTCKIKANGDGTTYSNSEYSSTITVTPTNTLYTVILHAGTGTVNSVTTFEWNVSMNEGVLPDAVAPCNTWSFGGWSTSEVSTQTTTAPAYVATHYVPTGDIDLYAVYTKTEGGASFDGTTGGNFLIYADVSGTNYYAQGTGSKINSTTTASEATTYTFEKQSGYGTNEFAIKTGSYYITYSSGTNLGTSTDPYKWTITNATAGAGTWRVLSGTNGRALIFQEGTVYKFGGYSTGNVPSNNNVSYYDIEIGGGTTTYYHSTPSCAAEQLAAPTVTLAAGIGSITPTWAAVNNASSYTLQYGTTNDFATNTYWEITNATSGTAITEHITNGTVYYVRVKSIGDGTTYTDSDWSTVVNATPVAVTTPTFSVEGISTGTANEYVDVAEVTITAPDYTTHLIYYTTDGSDPDENDELYEGGIDIITTGTTTIKAIAYDGDLNESEIGSITINVVATTPIATVYAAEDGDTYYITEGIVTYKRSGNNMFIEDDNAGILVYGSNNNYSVGDRVVIKGTKTTYQDKPELQNITILGKFSSGNTLPLNEISISDADDYMYRRVKYTQVLVGSTSDNLTTISQGTDNIGVYNMPSVTNVTDAGYYLKTITGIVAYYGGANQMYVASADDITSYTIDASSSNTALGTVTTSGYVVTATPASGVVYDNPAYVVVTDATDYDIDQTGDVFTIVTNGDMAIEIQFNTTAATHDVTFYVNGTADPTMAMEVLDGGELGTLPVATAPNGYAFMGWTETTITGVQANAPTMVASSTPVNDDMDLYAVFALEDSAPATLTKMTSGESFAANDKVVIVANDNVAMYQATISNSYVNKYTFDNDVATVAADDKNWFAVSVGETDGTWILGDATNGYVYNGTSNNLAISTESSTDFTLSWDNDNEGFTLVGNNRWLSYRSDLSSNNYFRMGGQTNGSSGPSGTVYFDIYKYNAGNTSYDNYCTTVNPLSGDLSLATTSANNAYYISAAANVPANTTVTINGVLGNDDASLLTINNGGQLIHNNAGVKATVHKSITGYPDADVKSGYTLIASPVNGAVYNNSAHTNLAANNYDLYAYDANEDLEWRNFEYSDNNLSTLNAGQGYLYANSNNLDLLFMGTLNTGINDVDGLPYVENNTIKSLYLAGNSLMHEQTFYVYDDELEGATANFLTINAAGNGFTVTSGTSITAAPMQGFFVQAAGTGWTLSTTDINADVISGNQVNPAPQLNIKVVRDRGVIDNAIVSFSNAPLMNKFVLNENATRIFVPMSDQEFAVIRAQAEAELPVNFKASENGSYTLSVKPEDVEMNYLHLVDNLTGADVDLLATPSYSFEAKTSDYASRFRLVFSANDENGASTGSATFAYYNGSEWTINNQGEATLQVIDVMGRVLSSETLNGNANVNLNQTAGIYMLRLVNGNDVKVQKVVVR